MLFQNLPFFCLCALTFALYWRFPASRLIVLALANAIFYLAAGAENLLLFLAASAATYTLGKYVDGAQGRRAMWLGIGLNLLNLAFFKYAGFLGQILLSVWTPDWLSLDGLRQVLLPIGISFYTFQNISYLVDRRTKGLASARSYLQYWVYISFFGHSIAGPIMRGHEFLPQVASVPRLRPDGAAWRYGLSIFALGLVKKVVIADHVAKSANSLFAHAAGLDFGGAWAAALLFAFQIYYDFSAYSDMAVGIGRLFGFELTQNFRTPYLAANASEFWSRWHITLSAWIRDYVYIPLGGSRVPRFRQGLNLVVAMLASGLWHGAAWTFVFWGAYHGALQLGQRELARLKKFLGWRWFDGPVYRAIAVGCFFLLVTWGWMLFRATSLDDAFAMMGAMLNFTHPDGLHAVRGLLALCAGLYALHGLEARLRANETDLGRWWLERVPVMAQGTAYAALALVLMACYDGVQDFIYFKF